MFVETHLWTVRTGASWHDLPDAFGEWNSVFRRFSRWSAKDIRISEAMSEDPEFECLIVDSTTVRTHQTADAKTYGPPQCEREERWFEYSAQALWPLPRWRSACPDPHKG